MKHMRKVFTMIMVLAMVLSLAVPAMAAEDTFEIVINHPRQLADHEYEAYQIFTGTLHIDANGKEILSTINWGTGIDGDAVLNDLKASPLFAEADSAQDVADIISANSTNTALVDNFRHCLGRHLINSQAIAPSSAVDGVYTWNAVSAGYYLIKDKEGSLDGTEETATNYILQVVGNTTITPKGGSVTHDKLIEDGGNRVEAADYSIGDSVKFVLRGTLPNNYADFETYEYVFADTLSQGLTFNNDVKVYLENAGTKVQLEAGFVVNVGENATEEGVTFTVDFANLKSITDRTIDQHTTIVVEYTATLNEDAVIGGVGNPNASYIIFDNDPHGDGKGETPEDKVFAFTWELDVNKINGSNDKLSGAEFILYRDLQGNHQYAKVTDGTLTGWTANREEAVTLVSDDNGKFIIKGLEADIYYLEETKAPDGYSLPDEENRVTTVDIIASVKESEDGTKGVVESLQIKVDNHPYADGDKVNGIVAMDVVNNPGATLPETGGMGTILFYVLGGLMVAAAVVLLVTKKRMGSEA